MRVLRCQDRSCHRGGNRKAAMVERQREGRPRKKRKRSPPRAACAPLRYTSLGLAAGAVKTRSHHARDHMRTCGCAYTLLLVFTKRAMALDHHSRAYGATPRSKCTGTPRY